VSATTAMAERPTRILRQVRVIVPSSWRLRLPRLRPSS
jgi:hypothetical protein